jgi:hypothetical protein
VCLGTGSSVATKSINALARQVHALQTAYPEGRSTWKRGAVTWIGELQPTPHSRTYRIRVLYKSESGRPRVSVDRPKLLIAPGKPLPHVFRGNNLCLHMPGEWNDRMLIAETILPWTSEWLLHYELWLATGSWHGGGHEPDSEKREG